MSGGTYDGETILRKEKHSSSDDYGTDGANGTLPLKALFRHSVVFFVTIRNVNCLCLS